MKNRLLILLLTTLVLINIALHLYKAQSVPPGFNVDEASYGYNAYLLIKTGKDEFGKNFPLLRLQSFGDFKLPMYTYLTVPSVAVFGLNEFAVRLPALISASILIIVMFFLAKELFDNNLVGVFASIFTTFSPGINMIARHAHEVVPTTLFITASFLFLLLFAKNKKIKDAVLFVLFISLALYTYHIARVFYVFFIGVFIYFVVKEKIQIKKLILPIIMAVILLTPFVYAEITTPPSRLGTLFILNHSDVALKTNQLKTELARSPFSQKLFVGTDEIARRYVGYFSTDFLIYKGDLNERFGFNGIGLINIAEYILICVGIYYIFRKKMNTKTFLLLLLAVISPLPAALTWQEYAINRTYFLLIPLLLIASFGANELFKEKKYYIKLLLGALISVFIIYTFQRWTLLFYHYPRRATVVRAWQAGYKEMMNIIKKDYPNYRKIYITKEVGQPYIFVLFYFPYSPKLYQQAVSTTKPDEYGYTQVEAFDKFIFNTQDYEKNKDNKNITYVMTESEGKGYNIPPERIEKIKIETEEMFWIIRP